MMIEITSQSHSVMRVTRVTRDVGLGSLRIDRAEPPAPNSTCDGTNEDASTEHIEHTGLIACSNGFRKA